MAFSSAGTESFPHPGFVWLALLMLYPVSRAMHQSPYFLHSELSRMPSGDDLEAVGVPANSSRFVVNASEIVFVVIGSCSLPGRLQTQDATWCSTHHPGVVCWAYVDCEHASSQFKLTSMRVLPPSQYVDPTHQPANECCSSAKVLDPSAWDGWGASTRLSNSRTQLCHSSAAPPLTAVISSLVGRSVQPVL